MTEEIDAKVMPEEIFVSRFVHGEACAFKVTLNNLTKYLRADLATRTQSGSVAGLVKIRDILIEYNNNFHSKLIIDAENLLHDILAAYRKENGHE